MFSTWKLKYRSISVHMFLKVCVPFVKGAMMVTDAAILTGRGLVSAEMISPIGTGAFR